MTAMFADSSYYVAIVNANDELHDRAIELTRSLNDRIVTTAWILTEVADAMSRPRYRKLAVDFIRSLQSDRRISVVPPSPELFDDGFDLFAHRPDKSWSLTDCISFVVMRQFNLTDALTADHHFDQAGFKAWLK